MEVNARRLRFTRRSPAERCAPRECEGYTTSGAAKTP